MSLGRTCRSKSVLAPWIRPVLNVGGQVHAKLARHSGGRLLSDVNTVYLSAHTMGFDACAHLDGLGAHAVAQFGAKPAVIQRANDLPGPATSGVFSLDHLVETRVRRGRRPADGLSARA